MLTGIVLDQTVHLSPVAIITIITPEQLVSVVQLATPVLLVIPLVHMILATIPIGTVLERMVVLLLVIPIIATTTVQRANVVHQ
jgi:hypothetical protein